MSKRKTQFVDGSRAASALRLGAAAVLLCLLPKSGAAQNQLPPVPATVDATKAVLPQERNIQPADTLGRDDLIELMVSYCPELTHTFRVASDGSLSLPLIHKNLMVAGLTPIQVSHLVERELREEHILADPTVNISVLEYRSRPVSVVGAVNHPLTFQATGETTVLDAIAKAGGLGPNAGGTIVVTSLNRSNTGAQQGRTVQVISVKDLIGGSDPRLNLKIEGNEEIRVPEATKIFVAGNVRHPGMYTMQGDTDTTVVKALALSEGLAPYSSSNAFIYRRRATGAERDEVKIPLSRILAHKSPDVALLADDILYIPASDGKRLTSKFFNDLAGLGQTAGAGILIYK